MQYRTAFVSLKMNERHDHVGSILGSWVWIPRDPSARFDAILHTYAGLTLGETSWNGPDLDRPFYYATSAEVDSNGAPLAIICAADLGDRYSYSLAILDGQTGADRMLGYLREEHTNDLQWGLDQSNGRTFVILESWRAVESIGEYLKTIPAYADDLAEVESNRVLDHVIPDQWGFSDEYTTCSECANVIRTSPDSYSWRADYWITPQCEILCAECVRGSADEYLDHAVWNAKFAVNDWMVKPSDHGFTQIDGAAFERGLHRGQNDDPEVILKSIKHLKDHIDVVYTYSASQFDVAFSLWARWSEEYQDTHPAHWQYGADRVVADSLAAHYRMPSIGPSDHAMAALRSHTVQS